MGLMDEFKAEGTRPRMQCRVALVKQALTPDEADDLDRALGDPVITAAAIERVLERKGYKLAQGTVTRHRRKECNCDK